VHSPNHLDDLQWKGGAISGYKTGIQDLQQLSRLERRVENNLEGEIFTIIPKPGFAALSAEAITTLTQHANKMLVFVCGGLFCLWTLHRMGRGLGHEFKVAPR
jgi:hypothetical protein